MTIKGDNLLTLKALLPYYAGTIKCIYIDPPYNTGNENWIYNDNINSVEIMEWLGKVVGKDAVDLSRHDKWLCMMYPRLMLAKEMLTPDGIIFISIDDNEYCRLIYLMDEIFGHKNVLANFIWQTEGNFDNQAKVKINHEYIIAYCKDINRFPAPPVIDPNTSENSKLFNQQIRNTIVKNGPKNPISEIIIPIGFPVEFENGIIVKRNNAWPHYNQDLEVKDYKTVNEVTVSSGWSSKKIFEQFIAERFSPVIDTKGQMTRFIITKTGAIEAIKERKADQSHVVSVLREFGSTQQASTYLETMDVEFDYPKPVNLIKYLISMNYGNDYTVLDFFGGSGTTAQAIMELNKDGGSRKFILVEWDEHIYQNVSLKRISEVANEMDEPFQTIKLGKQVYDDFGFFNKDLRIEEINRYIFYAETKHPIEETNAVNKNGFIGTYGANSIFVFYDSLEPEKSIEFGIDEMNQINKYAGNKIVYAIQCNISESLLKKSHITFKQIPYEAGGMK
jgi:adenine specific DNA methylase Mod